MKRLVVGFVILLAGCDGVPLGGGGGLGVGSDGGRQEFMVIGNRMTFEQCRARGGLIIRDAATRMIACDPTIRREPVPADEFDNPANPPAAT
ncbi:hypothetical protein [Yoonia sp. SS1-5]|uniref:Lipoprotein n=1 Tax=Yoonia rhodophyticola TaxID=3137370 RepID=A0AAN0NI93_9RHOB